jgi:PAS domain S-box-containing protein
MNDLPIQHVLAVDGDEEPASSIREFVEELGCSCRTASGPLEALDLLGAERFDLVIAETDMAAMDGLDLMLRARDRDSGLDFLLILSASSKHSAREIIAAGARDFISKPLRMEELKARLERIGRERRMLLNLQEAKDAFSQEVRMNSAFNVLSVALIDTMSSDEISSLVLKHAMRLTDSQLGCARCVDRKTGRLLPPVMLEAPEEDECRGWERDPFSDEAGGLAERVMEKRQSFFTNDLFPNPVSTEAGDDLPSSRRLIGAPALNGGSLLGALALAGSTRKYTERDLIVLDRLAALYALRLRRKWRNEEVREAKSYLEKILDNTVAVIGIVDKHGKTVRWNRYAVELLGYSLEELREKHFSSLYANEEELTKMLSQLRGNGFVNRYKIDMLRSDHTIAPVEVSIGQLRDDAGNLLGSVGVAMDMSDLNRALSELRAINGRLQEEISERGLAEEELREARKELEELLDAQSTKLAKAGEILQRSMNRMRKVTGE